MASSSPARFASYSCERRPRLLKDFLTDDSVPSSSCSSSNNTQLLRSRSKATSISISAIHKASEMVINAIKFFPFASSTVKSHSILPRSIARKLLRSRDHKDHGKCASSAVVSGAVSPAVTPKIKDILRWKSFRDVVEEISSNWYERDFAADQEDYLPSWGGENNYDDFMDHKKMEGQSACDENEQHSPVSILDNSPFRDHEGSLPFFNRSVSTIERRKCMLMQRIQEFETLAKWEENFNQEEPFATQEKSPTGEEDEETIVMEAKARQLLSQIKATSSSAKTCTEPDEDCLLLDFFRHELAISSSENQKDVESSDSDMLRFAKSWMSREYCEGTFDCEVLEKTEASVRDMETGLRWDKFDEEQQELGRELEIHVLNDLFDEMLVDLVIQ